MDFDVRHAAAAQAVGDALGHAGGVAVHGAIDDRGALRRLLAAHAVVKPDDFFHAVATVDGAVRRADHPDRQRSGLFEGSLHVDAEAGHDSGVIAARFVGVNAHVQLVAEDAAVERAVAAESVAGKGDAAGVLEGDHRLGPVHHRDRGEGQAVRAQRQRFAVLHFLRAHGRAIELPDQSQRLFVGDDGDVGVHLAQHADRAGMVGLDVVNDQIVHGAAADDALDALEIFAEKFRLDAVDQRHFSVVDQIGIVGDAVGQRPQIFEERRFAVVDADPPDFVRYGNRLQHEKTSRSE